MVMIHLNQNQNIKEIVKDINANGLLAGDWSAEDCAAQHALDSIYASSQTVCYQIASEVLNNIHASGALFNVDVAVKRLLAIPFMS